jgi:hypothetical protein
MFVGHTTLAHTQNLEQESGTLITTKGTPRRKRNVQQINAVEQADRAATEIVDLVEQDAQRSAGSLTGSSTPSAMHQSPSMATGAVERYGIHRTRGGGGDPRVGNH